MQGSLFSKPPSTSDINNPFTLQSTATYDQYDILIIEDQIVVDNLFIMDYANITIINSTIQGNIYVFNRASLYLFQNSNVTEAVVSSDTSKLYIDNSTIGIRIECRDSSSLTLKNSITPATAIWKLDSANITITNSSLFQFSEFIGVGGQNVVIDSQIQMVTLSGFATSRTYITNSTILMLQDLSFPFSMITGPIPYEYTLFNYTYSSSGRQVNFTWIGWDSPIKDDYLNISFHILVDNQFLAEINGSGFVDQYAGHMLINFTETGLHNITLISFDGAGNNYSSTIKIEIIEYPSFPWTAFILVVVMIIGFVLLAAVYLNYKSKHGYHSSLGNIFKKEFSESKIKIIIFIAIAAAPGIILYFIFGSIVQATGHTLSIDSVRALVSMIFTMILYYFGLAFSIVFAAGAVVNDRKSGSLSWFLSKPIRRWEFLWGKTFAYLLIIVLAMTSTAISFVFGSIRFIDPLYLPDLYSMGGYIFLIGLLSVIPLTSIVILCSSVFKKPGLAIFIPIILLIALPPIVSFLPILTHNEIPNLFSFTFYSENLGSYWIYQGGGLFGSIGTSYGAIFGIEITPLNLSPLGSILILSAITIVCLTISTYSLQKADIA